MAVTVFNDATGNGTIAWQDPAPATWTGARDSASCNTGPTNPHVYGVEASKPSTYYLARGFVTFLTGNILAGATISSAVLSLYGHTKNDATSKSVCLVASTQANPTGLAQADWDQFGTTEFASRITIASWSTSGYNDFTLNASGIAAINTTAGGYSKFCLRISNDVDNAEPTSADDYAGWWYKEDGVEAKYPKLTVTYTLPGGASSSYAFFM